MKGFTLVEVLITITILAAIAAVGGINLFGYYSRQNFELTIDEIMALIRDAQNRSLSQQDGNADGQGDQWGLHFENTTQQDSVKLFCCGTSYAAGALISVYNLRTSVQFTDPNEGNSKDMVFSKLTGYPNIATSITINLRNNLIASSTITVSAIGRLIKTGL
jgi:prepilin-type N-terminal cleavage/methylation domain-containing protein